MDADVIVVGAGPAGSTVGCYLARAGLTVLILEKGRFPREKVCGDGLTPRAVRELVSLGIDLDGPGWFRNRGLRLIGDGRRVEVPWPQTAAFPDFGLTRTRYDFDQILAEHARKAGARLMEGSKVTGPVLDERTGRVVGVRAEPESYRARLVVAADGASSRMAVALGMRARTDRRIGVAARRYYRSPRHDDDLLEMWLTVGPGGYGWVFGAGDGTSNVGVAMLGSPRANYQRLLHRWLAPMPPEWGFTEENATSPIRGAALPMGFSRQPHYRAGLLLAGDSGGMINPANGEGIAYAMQAGRIAADIIAQALVRPTLPQQERTLQRYPEALKTANGGAFTLGRLFVNAIENPSLMRLATRQGMAHPTLMRFAVKVLGNLTDPRGRGAEDRFANALARIAPTS